RPAVEKRPERSVRLPHVDVQSAWMRQHRAELGKGERAAEDQQPRKEPDADHESRLRNPMRDQARRDEDARADDRADEQRGAVEEIEFSWKFGDGLRSVNRGVRQSPGAWLARLHGIQRQT